MVKKKVGGGKRFQNAIKSKAQNPDAPAPTRHGPAPPKHLQRKISKKVGFLDKVAASKVAALAAKSSIAKKRKAVQPLADLSSLSGTVNELLQEQAQQLLVAASQGGKAVRSKKGSGPSSGGVAGPASAAPPRKKFGEAVGTLRARAAITAKESARAQQVVQHPLYKLDPIQAISNHLNATLPAAPAPKAARAADKGKRPRKKKKGGKGEMDTAE